METLEVRRVGAEAAEQVVAMQNRAFHDEQGIPEETAEGFLEKSPICWGAFLGEEMAGSIASWQEEGRTHVGRFVVDMAYRGQHIGKKLISAAFADLFAHGEEELYMEARAVTVKLVTAMGGQVVGETVPFFKGTITPMILRREDFRPPVL